MRQHSAELSEAYRAEGYWTDRLLTDFFESAVKSFPEKVAVVDERFGAVTYSELESIVLRLAAALRARGMTRGDKFVIALPNWHHVSAFLLALGYIGAVSVHMPVTGREHEFASVLRISGAKGIVVPGVFRDNDFVSMIGAIAGELESLEMLVSVAADRIDPGWITYEQLLSEALGDVPGPDQRVDASDITSLLFTSGSSGDPKGVMHSSNTLGALNTTVAPLYDLGPEDVIFMGAPLGYSAGLVHGVRLANYLGATLVLQESWNADRALELMARERATFTLMTPTLLRDLFESEAFPDSADRLSLRLIFCGGSYVPASLLRSARERLPATLTSVIWGMTEGIGTACRPATSEERVIGTDGQPFLGTELRVLKDNGDEARVGEEGELVMRGPQRFLGYFDRPDSDEQVFLPGGWFRTGDVASIDADGFVKITGRLKELIIRGGVNISPAEIEAKLLGDPRIRQLAIVDIPDERLGERVCACVVAAQGGEGLALEDLVDLARKRGLAKHKWPERLEMMESLPVTSAGKIRRQALREQVRRRIQANDVAGAADSNA
jgi:acyl-CoA synthetase (AMP-forming)/AMP-acid ligase II